MLVALQDGSRIEADVAVRSHDYHCPACGNIVHVRRRLNWVTHFFHLVHRGCDWENEGRDHRAAKHLIGEEYKRRGFDVAYEWTLEDERRKHFPRAVISDLPMRRTDVMIWRTSDNRAKAYAVEIQDSHLAAQDFLARVRDWESFGIAVLWLVVPQPKLLDILKHNISGASAFRHERYSIRPFERLIWQRSRHIWFIVPSEQAAFCAQIKKHQLLAEKFVTYDHSAGDFQEAGGYEYESKRYVDLDISTAVKIEMLKINATGRYATWQ